jgi:hypothetical protein
MSLLSGQGLKMAALVLGLLGIVTMPALAEEKQDVMSESARMARI